MMSATAVSVRHCLCVFIVFAALVGVFTPSDAVARDDIIAEITGSMEGDPDDGLEYSGGSGTSDSPPIVNTSISVEDYLVDSGRAIFSRLANHSIHEQMGNNRNVLFVSFPFIITPVFASP